MHHHVHLRKKKSSAWKQPMTWAYFAAGAFSFLLLRGAWKSKVADGDAGFNLPEFLKSPKLQRFIPGSNGSRQHPERAGAAQ
jgi:hypothetical protein